MAQKKKKSAKNIKKSTHAKRRGGIASDSTQHLTSHGTWYSTDKTNSTVDWEYKHFKDNPGRLL